MSCLDNKWCKISHIVSRKICKAINFYYCHLLANGISDKSLIKFTIGIDRIKSIMKGIIAIEILIPKRIRSKKIL